MLETVIKLKSIQLFLCDSYLWYCTLWRCLLTSVFCLVFFVFVFPLHSDPPPSSLLPSRFHHKHPAPPTLPSTHYSNFFSPPGLDVILMCLHEMMGLYQSNWCLSLFRCSICSRTVVLLSSLSRDCSFSLSCTFCCAPASSSPSTSATRLAAATNRCAYHLVHRRNRELTTKPASHPSTPFVRHIVSTCLWRGTEGKAHPLLIAQGVVHIPDGAEAAWPRLWLLGWDRRCLGYLHPRVKRNSSELGTNEGARCQTINFIFIYLLQKVMACKQY